MSEPAAKKKKPGKTQVLLVRHGATVLTAEDRCGGNVKRAKRKRQGAEQRWAAAATGVQLSEGERWC